MTDETWDTTRLAGGLAEFWWACQGGDPTDAPLAEHDAKVRAEERERIAQAIEAWIRHGEAVPADVTTYDRWIVHTELRALLEPR